MTIYNVLFKAVETNFPPFCKAFKTQKEATKWIEETMNDNNLTGFSTMSDGSNPPKWEDLRTEDKKGNTYYFVTYFQEI